MENQDTQTEIPLEVNRVLIGDCLNTLKTLPDNSIDSVVTDPPYGLSKEPNITEVLTKWLSGETYSHSFKGFMGKEWDSFVPSPDVFKEVYRVLKPGGHALVFAGTRTQDLMTISLRLAGFEVRDVVIQAPEWAGMDDMIVAKLKDGGGFVPAQPYQADLLAADWEVVSE